MVRWLLAALVLIAVVAAVLSGVAQVCAEQAVGGELERVCRPPRAGDAITLAVGLVLGLLLVPDVAEIGVPGLVQVKRRLDDQDSRLSELDAHLTTIAAQMATAQAVAGGAVVNVVSGVDTGRFAVEAVETEVGQLLPPDPRDPLAPVDEALDRARYVAAELLVAHLGDVGSGSLAEVNLRLYLPADDGGTLRPVLDEAEGRRYADSWPSGQGVVGRAWRDGEIVVARGREVTEGLAEFAPERAARYAQLAVVVGLPVFNATRRPIAVLSASSRDPGSGLDTPETISELIAAGEVVARVLVDLLGWAADVPLPAGVRPAGRLAPVAGAEEVREQRA